MSNYRTNELLQDSLTDNPPLQDTLSLPAKNHTDSISRISYPQRVDNSGIINEIDSSVRLPKNILLDKKITVNDLLVVDSVEATTDRQLIVNADNELQYHNIKSPINRFNLFYADTKKIDYKPSEFWIEEVSTNPVGGQLKLIPHNYQPSQFNWTLLIGFLSVLLLIGLKSYYQKFVNQVINTIVNFQLADKLLREKNIIARRAFFMMNINFVLIFGLFLLLLASYWQIRLTNHYFYDYLIILALIISVLLARLLLLYLTGIIFETRQIINEQVHNSYLINKNLGLVLLPLVFTAVYTTQTISHIILFTGLILFAIATLYRLIRGFQIILRSGVLFYYAILYLCTLELLPLVIGSKILISLR